MRSNPSWILRKDERHKFLETIQERTHRAAQCRAECNFYLEGRVKSIYGIYRKVYMQGRDFDEIFDVYAVRVIVDTVNECYNVLGIMHDMFRPIPNRFKDYISTPKANMYQSLHTTVLDKEGIPFEIQIRTWDMHHTAEYGIAAHWKYKAGLSGQGQAWRSGWPGCVSCWKPRRRATMWRTSCAPSRPILPRRKCLSSPPKGDVISLPSGSTVIDFAYAIHTRGGQPDGRRQGGRTNGHPIDYQVKTGMIIEIITTNAKGHGPNRDWLKMVKTSEARNKIRAWFKKEKREENIAARTGGAGEGIPAQLHQPD